MKSPTFIFFLAITALVLICADVTYACSCLRVNTCASAAVADVVFVGEVISSEERTKKVIRRVEPMGGDWEEYEYKEKRQISRLIVKEIFYGIGDAKEILIETETASSCAFPLQKGETYIVYANRSKDEENLMTGFCSGTRAIALAGEEIQTLRDNRDKNTTIYGKVGFGEYGKLDATLLPKVGVSTVRLTGENESWHSLIGIDGSYKFTGVLKGSYRLQVIVPEQITVREKYDPEIAEELGIEDQTLFSVNGIGCKEEDFLVEGNGRLGGRLVDAGGKPIENVTVQLIPVDRTGNRIPQDEDCYDSNPCVSADEDGRFFFKGLKAGKYLVGVRLSDWVCNDCADAEYKKAFYPGVAVEKRAKPVTVGFGKLTDNIDFKLIRKYTEREIKGQVFFKDGRSAANVRIRYVARTPDRKNNGVRIIKTDDQGYFSIDGYDGHDYLIGAFTDSRDGNERVEAGAKVVSVLPGNPLKPLLLTLNQNNTDDDFWDFPTAKSLKK